MHLPARFSALALAGALLLAPSRPGRPAVAGTAAPAGPAAGTTPARATLPAPPPACRPAGGALVGVVTGAVMWSRGMNTERPMGSITKVMTAIVVLQAGDLHRRIEVRGAYPLPPATRIASNAGLRPGDYLTARELLGGHAAAVRL